MIILFIESMVEVTMINRSLKKEQEQREKEGGRERIRRNKKAQGEKRGQKGIINYPEGTTHRGSD